MMLADSGGQPHEFHDLNLGEVEVPIPRCKNMVEGQNLHIKNILPTFGGESYWLESSDGEHRVYKTYAVKGKPEKTVEVEMSLKVNGVPLR